MPIDASIYNNVQPAQVPSYADMAKNAMSLSQLAMQNNQMQRSFAIQQATRQAYARNLGPDGKVNEDGYLSDLGRIDPNARYAAQEQIGKANQSYAAADSAKTDAAQKILSITHPVLQQLASMPEDQRAQEFPLYMQRLAQQGVPMHNVPMANGQPVYDPSWFKQTYNSSSQMKDYLDNQKTIAETGKANSETMMAPVKLNSDLYGSRSPNAELTSQYDKQAAPIRSSQIAMNQMIDNYKNPNPQGDKSLVLNAFRIKFPNAPDVNSLEELAKAQSVPDTWRQMAASALQGGLDQPTRDNLMRDGVSTFRANVDSLKGIQERYTARAKQQNVNDPTLTAEPAIDKTYANALQIQNKIGPYVPPADRGGFMAGVSKLASRVMGAGPNSAGAAETKTLPPPPNGMIRVRAPDGRVGLIQASQRGEAIAAGGSVVK